MKPSEPFLALWSRMLANWPVDEQRLPALSREYLSLFHESGEARFAQAVEDIIRQGPYTYFPTIAEFRGYIPKAPTREYCGQCNRGWIYVPDYAARNFYGNDTAVALKPCTCTGGADRTRHIREKAEREGQYEWIPPDDGDLTPRGPANLPDDDLLDPITPEERHDRTLHPENWFGYADLVVMVMARAAARKKGREMPIEEAWEIAMEARKLIKQARSPQPFSRGKLESVQSIIKRKAGFYGSSGGEA